MPVINNALIRKLLQTQVLCGVFAIANVRWFSVDKVTYFYVIFVSEITLDYLEKWMVVENAREYLQRTNECLMCTQCHNLCNSRNSSSRNIPPANYVR